MNEITGSMKDIDARIFSAVFVMGLCLLYAVMKYMICFYSYILQAYSKVAIKSQFIS